MVMALEPEKKEKNVKSDWCYPVKDPSTVKSIFSVEHEDGKLLIAELTLGGWDLPLLLRVRSGSTCLDPPPSSVMWEVNRENGIHGVESEEFPPRFKSNVSWSNYVEPLENFL